MLLRVPAVLDAERLARVRATLERAEWVDGRETAGAQSARVKRNAQVREETPEARAAGDEILAALERSALFVSAALPSRIFPPLFNRYESEQAFGTHVDNAIRRVPGTPHRIRTDLSATLFLSAPETYDGGELVVEDVYGVQAVKLPAGDLVLYPASSLHHVRPVTRGTRLASFFWIQSMVRDDAARAILFDLDVAIQRVERGLPQGPGVALTAVYHNLLRRWAEL